MAATHYSTNDTSSGYYKVCFVVNATKSELTRCFNSEYLARRFVNKLKHSKKCTLLAYPLFK